MLDRCRVSLANINASVGNILPSLRDIAQLPECQGAHKHFVDDRIETLQHMAHHPAVAQWHLYFASWGYSTPEEQALARSLAPRVQWLELEQYMAFLTSGDMPQRCEWSGWIMCMHC